MRPKQRMRVNHALKILKGASDQTPPVLKAIVLLEEALGLRKATEVDGPLKSRKLSEI